MKDWMEFLRIQFGFFWHRRWGFNTSRVRVQSTEIFVFFRGSIIYIKFVLNSGNGRVLKSTYIFFEFTSVTGREAIEFACSEPNDYLGLSCSDRIKTRDFRDSRDLGWSRSIEPFLSRLSRLPSYASRPKICCFQR